MGDTNTSIARGTLVEGRITGDRDLEVLGRVDGAIEIEATLYVEEPGLVVAEARVVQAVISGTFVGKLVASDSIQVTESGRVSGELEAPRILVEEGAALDATLTTNGAPPPAERAARPTSPNRPTRPASPSRSARAERPTRPAPAPAGKRPAPPARKPSPPAPRPKVVEPARPKVEPESEE